MKVTRFKEAKIISITAPSKEELRKKVEEFCNSHKKGYSINLNKIEQSLDGQYTIKIQIREVEEVYIHRKSSIPPLPKEEFERPL